MNWFSTFRRVVDWSPDGRFLAFSRGPHQKRLGRSPAYLGIKGEGWNICVADATQQDRYLTITVDGHSNREPDWVLVEGNEP